MSDAREQILKRLRSHIPTEVAEAPLPQAKSYGAPAERLRQLRTMMEAVHTEIHAVRATEWPQLLQRLCEEKGIQSLAHGRHPQIDHGVAALQGALQLQAYDEAIESWKEALFFDIDAGLTSTRGAVAETGSLILWPSPEEPRLLSLVPPVHFALLAQSQIYHTLGEAMTDQLWAGGMPTNALLVSGPSKTADIEQTLAYGVHGPKALVVLVLTDE